MTYDRNAQDNAHILIVDDDDDIRSLLATVLEKYGYRTSTAANSEEMATALNNETIKLIVLDIMMPGTDGISICKSLRQHSTIPIIMLSAMGEDTDRIVGLEVGADDYLSKPFNPRELVARIKSVLRRHQSMTTATKAPQANALRFNGWTLLLDTRSLLSPQKLELPLSTSEFGMLRLLLEHPQKILSRDYLLDHTKNRLAAPFDRSVDMQISRLRQKIEQDAKNPTLIKTIRGGGYMLTATVEKIRWL